MLVIDPESAERARNEGYLPKAEFRAWMEAGLARLAFVRKQWAEAELRYGGVAGRYPQTVFAPEAIYWKGVSRYKMNDHGALGETASELGRRYPEDLWTIKASVWSR